MRDADRAMVKALRARLAVGGACLLIGAAALAPAASGLTLQPDVQRRLGVKLVVLKASRRTTQVAAFAKVLDPGPLAALESDLDTSVAAAAASAAEAARARALSQGDSGVAKKDAESAVAQARADSAKLALLRQRLGLEWGPGVARLSDVRRRALVTALAGGRAALVQIDTPSSEGQDGARTVEIDIGSTTVHAAVIGPSRTAEPRLQSSGLIALVTGPSAVLFSVGLTQSARINQPSTQIGVLLPRSALFRYGGADWAYARTGADDFERRPVVGAVPEDQGYFVARGFAAGDAVAVQGVAALFAAEKVPHGRGD